MDANAICRAAPAAVLNSNDRRTADVLLRFNRPVQDFLYRAYDHVIAVRRGMTLMVPACATAGRLIPVVDCCPVPWLEAAAVLEADYASAAPLSLVALVRATNDIDCITPLGLFAQSVLDLFVGSEKDVIAVALADKDWRHTTVTLARGGEPCRVFIGAAGVRLAFTPDFLEGLI